MGIRPETEESLVRGPPNSASRKKQENVQSLKFLGRRRDSDSGGGHSSVGSRGGSREEELRVERAGVLGSQGERLPCYVFVCGGGVLGTAGRRGNGGHGKKSRGSGGLGLKDKTSLWL